MQHVPEDIKRRLLGCIDEERNVTDMASCLVIISALESMSITKKVLEETRLGLIVNEIRRKAIDQDLSRRLKQLVKKWRETCLADKVNGVSQNGAAGYSGGSKHGRESISPSLSVLSLPISRGELSPYSLPSSGNASPSAINAHHHNSALSGGRIVSPAVSNARSNAHSRRRTNSPLPLSSSKPVSSRVGKSARNVTTTVPKTIVANKRLRKLDDIRECPPAKRPRTGVTNGFEDECSRDSVYSTLSGGDRASRASNDGAASVVVEGSHPPAVVRRSGRRRKSHNDPPISNPAGLDALKQKMAVIGKVKTTSQLVADLAKKKGDEQLARRASILGQATRDHVSKNKMEHMQRFLKSQPDAVIDEINLADDDDIQEIRSPQSSASSIQIIEVKGSKSDPFPDNPGSPVSNMDLLGIKDIDSTDEILSRLPPIDFSKLSIRDEDACSESSSISDSGSSDGDDEDKLKCKALAVDSKKIHALHSVNIDSQNGTYDTDARFKEWHETVLKKSYQDTPLVILPYVITEY